MHENTAASSPTVVEFEPPASLVNSDEQEMSLYVDNLLDDALETRPTLTTESLKPLTEVTNHTDG